MKAKYIKPAMTLEPAMMTGSLLRDCSDLVDKNDFTAGDPLGCSLELPNGMNVFLLGASCQLDGEGMELGCYNNPGEGYYIFRS